MDDFPDVNVWVALSSPDHPGHLAAKRYFEAQAAPTLWFSWATAMGLIRVTSHRHTFGGTALTPSEAWANFLRWRARSDIELAQEPPELEQLIGQWVEEGRATGKNWTDLYLAAIARGHKMRFVTFDREFQSLSDLELLVLA